ERAHRLCLVSFVQFLPVNLYFPLLTAKEDFRGVNVWIPVLFAFFIPFLNLDCFGSYFVTQYFNSIGEKRDYLKVSDVLIGLQNICENYVLEVFCAIRFFKE
ncbi:MAG: hypothetical protein MUP22_09300, partial [Desulfobacterales bacterium]|nr:hypothetical protein [Desulfobacterales bacterium]